ncbi:MAG TPA: hypothetical protein VGP10_07000 [Marisediminicola sp.]|nr:hypothetical protein [Marisediminicola sp.]
MPTEAELRDWLHGERAAVTRETDMVAVIRRSRRRRLPKRVAAGGALTLAIAGLGVAGVTVLDTTAPGGASMSAAHSTSESAPEKARGGIQPQSGTTGGGSQPEPASKLNACGGELAVAPPSRYGLVLSTAFPPTAPAGSKTLDGRVVLTNTGSERVTGTTVATPTITVSKDGVVQWHSNGLMIQLAAQVDLAPGESIEYPATLSPVLCSEQDDPAGPFRDDLPPLEPGQYQISAAITLTPGDAGAIDLVTGPVVDLNLG